MISDWLVLPAWIAAGLLVVAGILRIMPMHPLQIFWADRASTPFDQQQAELSLRMAAVRLRRRASLATIDSPGRYREHISRIAKEEAMKFTDRAQARDFLAWAGSAPVGDILLPPAFKKVYRLAAQAGRRPGTATELSDALRIRG